MFGAKAVGLTLLAGSAMSVFGAVALGVTAVEQQWEPDRVLAATAALAMIAEACFWLGGGLVGLSMIRRRRVAVAGWAGRVAFLAPMLSRSGSHEEKQNAISE
ncbi:hypothetical protein [Parvularcula lutaonensis]|uniref:Uncharacterized protein n=1 Tax=Parvularcula lutaonensis TaxID=491923 RepID=A0ABV7MCA4_9PROT|nr:hypothetical protein [Parvularcula lutaonensis]GGY36511.1 hypothetical protein GCM10007148_00860 [Parvularcula lutaonensis]